MDFYLFQQINNLVGKWALLDNLAIFFAEYFEYILVISVFVIFRKQVKTIFQSFAAAVLARFGIVELIRFFWPKPRPFVANNIHLLINEINKSSFPSGHAAFYFALSFVVYKYNKKTGILFFIASFLICLSRVFVGVHWPLDIVAGALVGIFSGWLVIKISPK